MSKWIKKGDKVIVISGNEKGKTGTVLSRDEDKILIQGINIRKKHAKRRQKTAASEILEIEMPIHVSNIKICSTSGKPVKIKCRLTDESKELFYLENGKPVVHRQIKHKTSK
ncbi:MAG TPA: 50S ribosomal protein L24 [Rhabdochlamydiaceae bacterium]|nr:50S ribosomal protein L24 [Rhabdochlamydiaceae bacterium]